MLLVLHLAPDAARRLSDGSEARDESEGSDQVRRLLELAEALGLALVATHPGVHDPALRTHFHAQVADRAEAERAAAALLKADAVEAAYFKPPDEFASP